MRRLTPLYSSAWAVSGPPMVDGGTVPSCVHGGAERRPLRQYGHCTQGIHDKREKLLLHSLLYTNLSTILSRGYCRIVSTAVVIVQKNAVTHKEVNPWYRS